MGRTSETHRQLGVSFTRCWPERGKTSPLYLNHWTRCSGNSHCTPFWERKPVLSEFSSSSLSEWSSKDLTCWPPVHHTVGVRGPDIKLLFLNLLCWITQHSRTDDHSRNDGVLRAAGVMGQACHSDTQEVEARGLPRVQAQSWLHSKQHILQG